MADQTSHRILYLDGWRGTAILSVLVGHFWLDASIPGLSTLGVDLFFVLSGRLMAEILFVKQVPLPKFFVRRFSRVYPALLVFVLLAGIGFAATPYGFGLLAAGSALTFTLNYAVIYFHPTGVLDHLWSLSVEEHGYLVLAVLAFLVGRKFAWGTGLLFVIGAGAIANGLIQHQITGDWFVDVSWRSDVQIAPLFLGGAFFLLSRNAAWLQWPWLSPICLVAGLAAKLSGAPVWVDFGVGSVLLAIAVATMDFAPAAFKRLFEGGVLRQIGLWSFSLYLWQQPFYQMAEAGLAGSIAMASGAVLLGLVSFYAVEGPARVFINTFRERRLGMPGKTRPG